MRHVLSKDRNNLLYGDHHYVFVECDMLRCVYCAFRLGPTCVLRLRSRLLSMCGPPHRKCTPGYWKQV